MQLIVSIPLRAMSGQASIAPLLTGLVPILLMPSQTADHLNVSADTLFYVCAAVMGLAFSLHAWVVVDHARASRYSPTWRIRLIQSICG